MVIPPTIAVDFSNLRLILTLLSAQDYNSSASHELVQRDISVFDEEVDYWSNELEKIDETISLLNENLERNPEGYGLASKAFVSQILTQRSFDVRSSGMEQTIPQAPCG